MKCNTFFWSLQSCIGTFPSRYPSTADNKALRPSTKAIVLSEKSQHNKSESYLHIFIFSSALNETESFYFLWRLKFPPSDITIPLLFCVALTPSGWTVSFFFSLFYPFWYFFFSIFSTLFFSDLPVSSLNFIWIDQTVPLVELCRCANPVAPYIILQSDLWIFGSNEGAGLIPLSLERFLLRLALYRIATLFIIFFLPLPTDRYFYIIFFHSPFFFYFYYFFFSFCWGHFFFIVSQNFLLSSLCSILLCELNATVLNHHVPILRVFFSFTLELICITLFCPPPSFLGTHLRISHWRSIKF